MRAYVGIGSNLGDRWSYLRLAARELRATPRVVVVRASHVYETAPVGPAGQGAYLNAVLALETSMAAIDLLRVLQRLEGAALRRRAVRWGPRTLDLDLLLYGGAVVETPILTVPHPGLVSRRFVLAPLAELCPDLVVPGTADPVGALLAKAPPLDVQVVGLFPAS